jgi:hypothetical protein
VEVRRAIIIKGVLLANLASYAVLGPVYFLLDYPRTDIREYTSDTSWVKEATLAVVALGPNGQLEAATADGHSHRVVVPHEVRDYVVSADLTQVLYRGTADQFYLFNNGTNQAIPELGFRCAASQMDFSPAGKYAAFLDGETQQIRVFDSTTGQLRDVPTFGDGHEQLIWSSGEDTFYLKSQKNCWEIEVAPAVAYTRLTNSPSAFANHFGRVGNVSSRDGSWYMNHQQGMLELAVEYGWGNRLVVYNQHKILLKLKDPAGQLGIEQAVFLEGRGEVLVGVGDFVYILDVLSKRMGPVMGGQQFIALAKPFAKQIDF